MREQADPFRSYMKVTISKAPLKKFLYQILIYPNFNILRISGGKVCHVYSYLLGPNKYEINSLFNGSNDLLNKNGTI